MQRTEIKWHKYPQEKPPKEDTYLVTVVDKIPFVVEAKYFSEKKKFSEMYMGDVFDDCVKAWAEMPKPYKEENNG